MSVYLKIIVVFDLAKIIILKAIHNKTMPHKYCKMVVFDLAKIIILKAIHNTKLLQWFVAFIKITFYICNVESHRAPDLGQAGGVSFFIPSANLIFITSNRIFRI